MSTLAALAATTVLAADEGSLPAGAIPPIAFLVTALFAVAVFLLGWSLVRRIRRNHYRSEIRESLEAEIAERDATAGGSAAGQQPDGPVTNPRN